ncbi:hypothetical protein Rcae01_01021 [Novipirellula caenicola]|uniref:Uncharacterized protein n=1 Tax=Novipirellula caenicola TaxID=1536901 RepID=A0ABP9VK49_9BACT
MDFLVRQWCIRRTRKSIVRLKQQVAPKPLAHANGRSCLGLRPIRLLLELFHF